jgi:hypothetical protein
MTAGSSSALPDTASLRRLPPWGRCLLPHARQPSDAAIRAMSGPSRPAPSIRIHTAAMCACWHHAPVCQSFARAATPDRIPTTVAVPASDSAKNLTPANERHAPAVPHAVAGEEARDAKGKIGTVQTQQLQGRWDYTGLGGKGFWRTRWDSNPRYPFEVYTLSRRAPSTARPPVHLRRRGIITPHRLGKRLYDGNWTVFPLIPRFFVALAPTGGPHRPSGPFHPIFFP